MELVKSTLHSHVTDSYNTPTLPKNCIFYGVVERFSSQPEVNIVIEREKCIRPYNHFGDTENVGYPKLLFAYKIVGNRVASTAVVAVVDELVKPSSPVYVFPYGNVFHNGNICMGSYHHPEINPKDMTDVNYFPEAFYLIEHTHPKNSRDQVIKDILDKVEDKPFDDDLLIFYGTFEQWIDQFSAKK